MPYTPQTWENRPSTTTPINATRLGVIETGIATAQAAAESAASSAGSFVEERLTALEAREAYVDPANSSVLVVPTG